MRTGIDGDNISKTPLQEAAGGCWCDGKGYEIHWKGGTWGSVGEQHGASQLDGVWIKPLVGLKRFQRLHVLPIFCAAFIWSVSENQKPARFILVLIIKADN